MTPYDLNVAARILLTIATVGCTIIPVLADFNRTHATNPLWTGHARFHVVWQVMSYVFIGIILMYLIWTPRAEYSAVLYLVGGVVGSIYAGFFSAYFGMRLYGGRAFDDNGYLPIPVKIGSRVLHVDLNITVFSIFVVVLTIGMFKIV
ncbi:hypothetical protein [Kineobactrum salinum]|uniref:Uncharacterized protein n=1 Tax=Kineobactrum salinum TaxID=2708301 RepID=A0A6C0TWB5_9GAMM|nr:hypothetical protein [Kineobactrum salinum]QIB64112.1 hypothetical protein G3T16_00450 [Kineobactrum salinum]